jgi:methylisocitrate lyase
MSSMNQKTTLRQLLDKEKILICPEIYDCASAKAVEMVGFQAMILSSGELSQSMLGVPDLGLLSLDEIVWATDRICNFSPLPMIVDAEDGYGKPLNVYHTCKRLEKAGAAGILITDQADVGRPGVLPVKEALAKYRAARTALEGTDCLLVARCDVNPENDMEEAAERCNRYLEAGAEMTLLVKMHEVKGDKFEICKEIARRIPGWKWYPDLSSHKGAPEINLDAVADLGFKLVGVHYLMHAAMLAMLDTGRHVFQNRDNVYVDEHYKYTGYNFYTPLVLFGLRDNYWVNLEKSFVGEDFPEEDLLSVRTRTYFCRPTDKIL